MRTKIEQSDWLDEEVELLARAGLRTLVFASRFISHSDFLQWRSAFDAAKVTLHGRELAVRAVVLQLEVGMNLLGVTGVEDKLQPGMYANLKLRYHRKLGSSCL